MSETNALPIVGIGASAGGLEALQELVHAIPTDSGFCYVIVQHLAPDHPSIMDRLLSSHAAIPVRKIEDGAKAEANVVFVIPSGPALTLEGGRFRLHDNRSPRGHRTPIDRFFQSLADEAGRNAFCVVLSGTGRDGTQGLRAIKSAGGFAIVQQQTSARFPGMPESAAATGLVDFLLDPADIPGRLIDIVQHRERIEGGGDGALLEEIKDKLPRIIQILGDEDGFDFRDYKPGTLVRRIERRMMLLRHRTLDGFVQTLERDPDERARLLQDFLIGVTHFFRDPNAFDTLRKKVIEPLLDSERDSFRIWTPGCSTGEETFSVAMLFSEAARARRDRRPFQVFGTDIDVPALRHARQAHYPPGELAGVDEARRERFFTADNDGWQVSAELREKIVFAPHNVIQDPPFSRLDLIICRNLLIYLNLDAQRAIIPRFHYGLNPGGFLFLGPSESLGSEDRFFDTIDRGHRIFQRNDEVRPGYSTLSSSGGSMSLSRPRADLGAPPPAEPGGEGTRVGDTQREPPDVEAEQWFLREFTPPFASVSGRNEVLYLSEGMGAYVRPGRGAPSSALDMLLLRDLRLPVREAVEKCREEGRTVVTENIVVDRDGEKELIDVVAAPSFFARDVVMVVLRLVRTQDPSVLASSAEARTLADRDYLQRDLALTRQQLSKIRAEHETTEQELRSANEELLSMNEELQSSNEELETSREELQSINEELETINAELSENNRQLLQANSDLKNLFESTDIATLFLDSELMVRRFTPATARIFGIKERDVGRPIRDLASRIAYSELEEDAAAATHDLQPREREVRIDATDETFIARIRPYRTIDNRLDGCVVTFIDITNRKRNERQLEENAHTLRAQYAELETIYDSTPIGMCLMDLELRFLRLNETLAEMNGPTVEEHLGRRVDEVVPEIGDQVVARYRRVLKTGEAETGVEIVGVTPADPDNERIWLADYFPVRDDDGEVFAIGTSVREVTRERELRRRVERSEARLRRVVDNVNTFIATLTPEGIVTDVNAPALERAGLVYGDVADKPFWDCYWWSYSEESKNNLRADVARVRDGATLRHDAEVRVGEHDRLCIDFQLAPNRDADGNVVEIIASGVDVTERREAEARKEILLHELQHRVKNTLATTLSVMRFTARTATSVETFQESLELRISAIARTHDVLTASNWNGEDLRTLIDRELTAFIGKEADGRFDYVGPSVMLSPKQALTLALGVHELTVNAVKYGALSAPEGLVVVRVSLDDDGPIKIVWKESGGPRVPAEQDRREGFGTFLLKRALSADLGGSAELEFEPDGVKCVIEFDVVRSDA